MKLRKILEKVEAASGFTSEEKGNLIYFFLFKKFIYCFSLCIPKWITKNKMQFYLSFTELCSIGEGKGVNRDGCFGYKLKVLNCE